MTNHTFELPMEAVASNQPITINAGQESFKFSKVTWKEYKELTAGMNIKTTEDSMQYLEHTVQIMRNHLIGGSTRPIDPAIPATPFEIEDAKRRFDALVASVDLNGIDKLVSYFFQVTSDSKGQSQV